MFVEACRCLIVVIKYFIFIVLQCDVLVFGLILSNTVFHVAAEWKSLKTMTTRYDVDSGNSVGPKCKAEIAVY